MTALEQHLQAEIEKLRKEKLIMKKIGTSTGFYEYYFSELCNFTTNLECFNAVNELHFDFFGEYKYAGYESFRKYIQRKNKS
ncbi:MAG: hypothetical protein CMP76_17200 [Flavobacterium sp.]|uniref:hypothetical protein n=1 Tax=Flavobacterium sp. TaxID=239 RepID=UPI000C49A90D|nr:hypothetical protein [Flavobacterium sp.]MBF05016.1 hypothetical protein [Flavobacterium sp.]|tara:strand:- start:2435 stop:2680 length:246 start_codon:yes stop_codon:yes gene_type:complete